MYIYTMIKLRSLAWRGASAKALTLIACLLCLLLMGLNFSSSSAQAKTPIETAYRKSHPIGLKWSPDGQQLAYYYAGAAYVMDADGSNQRQIADRFPFAWSPDGQSLLMYTETPTTHQQEWWLYPVDGGARQRIFEDFYTGYSPVFSPDGSKILFYGSQAEADPMGIWVAEFADGITFNPVLLADYTLLEPYNLWDLKWRDQTSTTIIFTGSFTDDQPYRLFLPLDAPTLPLQPDQIEREPFYPLAVIPLAGDWTIERHASPDGHYAYKTSRIYHPEQGSFEFNHLLTDITMTVDEQAILYVDFCDMAETERLMLTGGWYGETLAAAQTSIQWFDLNTGTETTVFACGSGQQDYPAVSQAGSRIAFMSFDGVDWHIYRADREADGNFTLSDITPAAQP